jgi:hypothetical protein
MRGVVLNIRGLAPELRRRAKAEAARLGIPLRDFVALALAEKLKKLESAQRA